MVKKRFWVLLLLVSAGWEAVIDWSLLDSVITKLRSKGPTGAFVVDLILSPVLRLVLAAVALGFIIKGYTESRALAKLSVQPPEPKPSTPAPTLAEIPTTGTPPPTAPAKLPPPGRAFVDATVTPEHLLGFFDHNTNIQAQKLLAPVIGKWIRLSGRLGDVHSSDKNFAQLTFADKPVGRYFAEIFMYFRDQGLIDRLSVLKRGSPMTVIGQIRDVNGVELHLDNCELAP